MQPHITFDSPILKTCAKCKIDKPTTNEFFFRSRGSLASNCKDCRSTNQEKYDDRKASKGVPLTCEWCNKVYRVNPRRIEGRRFCSNSCCAYWRAASKNQQSPKERRCERCQKLFRTHHGKSVNSQRFCNDECRMAWFAEYSRTEQRGENNPNWNPHALKEPYYGSTWSHARAAVWQRDNETCRSCGKTTVEIGVRPDVHHIVPFAWFGIQRHAEANQMGNLITYCRACHMRAEIRVKEMVDVHGREKTIRMLKRLAKQMIENSQLELFAARG